MDSADRWEEEMQKVSTNTTSPKEEISPPSKPRRLQEMILENKRLKFEISGLRQENCLLKEEVQNLHKEAAQEELLEINDRMASELQTLQQQTAALKRDFKELKTAPQKLDEMRQNYPLMLEEIYRLEDLKRELQKEISILQNQSGNVRSVTPLYEDQTCRLNLLRKEAESLQQTKKALTDSLQHLKDLDSECDLIQAETQQIEERNAELSLEVKHLQEEIQGFGDLQDLQEKLCAVKEAYRNTKKNSFFFKDKKKELRSELHHLQQQNTVIEQQIEKLDKNMEKNEKIKKNYGKLLKKKLLYKEQKESLEGQISDLRVQEDDAKQLLSLYDQETAKADLLQEEMRRLQEKKADLIYSLQSLRNLECDFNNIKAENERSKKTNADLFLEVTQLQEEIQDFDNVQEEPSTPKNGPIILPSVSINNSDDEIVSEPTEKTVPPEDLRSCAKSSHSSFIVDHENDSLDGYMGTSDQEEDWNPNDRTENPRSSVNSPHSSFIVDHESNSLDGYMGTSDQEEDWNPNDGTEDPRSSVNSPHSSFIVDHESNSLDGYMGTSDQEEDWNPNDETEGPRSSGNSPHSSFIVDHESNSLDGYMGTSDQEEDWNPNDETEDPRSVNSPHSTFQEDHENNGLDEYMGTSAQDEHWEPNGRRLSKEQIEAFENPACSSFEKIDENVGCCDFQEAVDNKEETEPRKETASMEVKHEVLGLKEDFKVTSDDEDETKAEKEEVAIKDTNIFTFQGLWAPKRGSSLLAPISNTATKKTKRKKEKVSKKKNKTS
ncbi:uncharacterized protein LOC110014088 [Oryzias latipes]|uniref:uncharacterized protein LOC110014088 n=1 Tax=Oryzias latipes TaxID=8090 RepID=UPI000CE1C078|nr:uncharacterized protein LOC110014088 [Oryzias latipes]